METNAKIDQIIIKGGVPDIRFKWHDLSNLDLMTLITWQDHPLRITIESAQQELPLILAEPDIAYTLDGEPQVWRRGATIHAEEFREALGLPSDACLHLLDQETGEYELIRATDSLTIEPGMAFSAHIGPEPEAEATEDDGGGFLTLNTFTPTVAAGTKS